MENLDQYEVVERQTHCVEIATEASHQAARDLAPNDDTPHELDERECDGLLVRIADGRAALDNAERLVRWIKERRNQE